MIVGAFVHRMPRARDMGSLNTLHPVTARVLARDQRMSSCDHLIAWCRATAWLRIAFCIRVRGVRNLHLKLLPDASRVIRVRHLGYR